MPAISSDIPLAVPTSVRALPDRAAVAYLPIHLVVTALVLIGGLTAIGLRVYESPDSHWPIAIATGLVTIGLLLYARYFLRLPWLSASIGYLAIFWIFHYGMSFTSVVVPSVLDPYPYDDIEWMYWPNVRMAMILGVIGAAGFVFGLGLLMPRTHVRDTSSSELAHDAGLYIIGWVAMVGGIVSSVVLIAVYAGPSIFSMGYLNFLALSGSTPLGSTIPLAGLGCLLALCGASRRQWLTPLLVWSIGIAVPLLLLGARSGAMIPLVGFAVVLTHRGIRLSRGVLIVALSAALVAIPAIQAFRLVGFANRSSVNWTDVTPLDTLMELGGSLRATKAFVDWIEEGDPFLLGSTYWAPIDRQVLPRVIPGYESVSYADDDRLPGRLMDEREAGVGGSATGEAYSNFGSIGPFLYFAFIGLIFGALERWAYGKPYGCVFLGIAMSVFYFNIRGDWLPIPGQIVEGAALAVFCYVLSRVINPTSTELMRDDTAHA